MASDVPRIVVSTVVGNPGHRDVDLTDQLAEAAHIIASSREIILSYRATIDDLQARLKSMSDDQDRLQSFLDAKSDQLISAWSDIEQLEISNDEEQSQNQILGDTLARTTAELAAAKLEADNSQASFLATQKEAQCLMLELHRSRLENHDLQRALESAVPALGMKPCATFKRDLVGQENMQPVDGQHGYSLRPRAKRRMRKLQE